jgi:hypothetical protein
MILIFCLAIASSYVFYSMNSGITITNDGSHFALFDSLVTTGSPELQQVNQFAFNDSARYGDKFFSDRNPGLALSTYIFYQGARHLESAARPLHLDPYMAFRYTEDQESRIPLVMLVPALSSGVLFIGIFLLSSSLGSTFTASLTSALTLVFGTIALRYSTVFYSHIFASALLVWGLVLTFNYRQRGDPKHLCCGVFLISGATLAEHLAILAFIPVIVYLALSLGKTLFRPAILIPVVISGLVPMLALMYYNYVCFESPFSIAHFHHSSDTRNHEFRTMFKLESALKVLTNLLFGAPKSEVGRQDITGLMSASPFLYFALLWIPLVLSGRNKLRGEHMVLLTAFCLILAGAASFWAPYGGWDRDYRYFLIAVPLLAPFLAKVLDFLLTGSNLPWVNIGRYLCLALFVLAIIVSITNQLHHVRHKMQAQYNTHFPNWEAALTNVSVAVLVIVLIGMVLYGASRLVRR